MNRELHGLLCTYLGELTHKIENTFHWQEKEEYIAKYNAVCVLLDIDRKHTTFFEAVEKIVKEGLK